MPKTVKFDEVIIDREFADLIPPLDPKEYEQLKANIEKEGMRTPLDVWESEGKLILLDGHNRRRIIGRCPELQVAVINLPDREAAKFWIQENQLGRRNLSDDVKIKMATDVYEARIKQSRDKAAATAREAKADPGAVAGKTPATSKTDTLADVAKKSGMSQEKIKKEHRRRRESRPARQPKRAAKPPQFLAGLKVGDEVTLLDSRTPDSINVRCVEKLNDRGIYVSRFEGEVGHGFEYLFSRKTGKGKNRMAAHLSLRETTAADRAKNAARIEAKNEKAHQREAIKNKVKDLVNRIPEFKTDFYVLADGEIRVFFVELTLEQLERIVEALQPAPALAE